MDKNKIKNIALGVSLGLNIILGFFLGGGLISSCTSKKPVEASTSLASDAVEELAALPRERAVKGLFADGSEEIVPSDYPNLWQSSGENYTFSTGHALFATDTSGVFGYTPQANGRVEFNKINVAGLYYGAFTHSAGTWGGAFYLDRTNYTTLMHASPSDGGRANYKAEIQEGGSYFYVTQAEVDAGAFVAFSQNGGFVPYIYLIDGNELPASERVVFPRAFFPWQIWGDRATDVLIRGPSVDVSSTAETRVVMFNDLYFRCDGKTYCGIWLSFRYQSGLRLAKYDAAGQAVLNGSVPASSYNPSWFLNQMLYISPEDHTGVVVCTANMAQFVDTTALLPNPVWSKDAYRTIDIVDASGSSMSGVPTGVPDNTPLEWLDVIASAETIVVSNNGDPFSMLGNGFTAVAGILSIPILPFMTLGTLIAVPLIVLVILAILRLLAK